MYSVYHNDIFVHMYCTEPGNLLNIKNCMFKYQYLTNVELSSLLGGSVILDPGHYVIKLAWYFNYVYS